MLVHPACRLHDSTLADGEPATVATQGCQSWSQGTKGVLTLQRKGMLRQHPGLSKILTRGQEVSEKTDLGGLLETEIWA